MFRAKVTSSALLVCLLGIVAASPANGFNPSAEKSFFILDVSGSTNAQLLWTDGLRPSINGKLSTALGFPNQKGIAPEEIATPSDITVSIINSNSGMAPLIKIIEESDADKIWGQIINSIGGGHPTAIRLKAILADFLGPSGAYNALSAIYLYGNPVPAAPSLASCEKKAEEAFLSGTFMKNVTKQTRDVSSRVLCEIVIKIATAMKDADKLYATSKCEKSKCSDVIGAIKRMTNVARALEVDYLKQKAKNPKAPKPRMCIALASDMLNNNPNMSPSSALDTQYWVKKSASNAEAEKKGAEAATLVGVKFPSVVSVRVSVIGLGVSSGNSGIQQERIAFLESYWKGFWSQSGLQTSVTDSSLDEACK